MSGEPPCQVGDAEDRYQHEGEGGEAAYQQARPQQGLGETIDIGEYRALEIGEVPIGDMAFVDQPAGV